MQTALLQGFRVPLIAKIPFSQLQTKLGQDRFELIERLRLEVTHPQHAEISTTGYSFDPGVAATLEFSLRPYSAILFEVC